MLILSFLPPARARKGRQVGTGTNNTKYQTQGRVGGVLLGGEEGATLKNPCIPSSSAVVAIFTWQDDGYRKTRTGAICSGTRRSENERDEKWVQEAGARLRKQKGEGYCWIIPCKFLPANFLYFSFSCTFYKRTALYKTTCIIFCQEHTPLNSD